MTYHDTTARHTRSLASDSAQGPAQRARKQAIPSESAHACRARKQAKKKSGSTCRNAKDLPHKKQPAGGPLATSGKRGFRCVGHAHHGPLRSSGPARRAPSPRRRTSRCRVAHAGGATRADRSRLAAARAPRVQHARATKVAHHPPSARPIRPWVAGQQLLRPEQPQEPHPQLQPAQRDTEQTEPRSDAACGWDRVLEQHRVAAAALHLAVAHWQLHDLATVDHEHLAAPSAVDVPPRRRGDPSRAAGKTRSHASPRTRRTRRSSSGHREPRPRASAWRCRSDAPCAQRPLVSDGEARDAPRAYTTAKPGSVSWDSPYTPTHHTHTPW